MPDGVLPMRMSTSQHAEVIRESLRRDDSVERSKRGGVLNGALDDLWGVGVSKALLPSTPHVVEAEPKLIRDNNTKPILNLPRMDICACVRNQAGYLLRVIVE